MMTAPANSADTFSRPAKIAGITALTILAACTLSVWIFLSITHKHIISSNAMYPALRTGDVAMFLPTWVTGSPEPGDIAVYKRGPGEPKVVWVSRVIAGPGDKVAMKDGQLELNGKPVPHQPTSVDDLEPGFEPSLEQLPGGQSFTVVKNTESAAGAASFLRNMAERTVPDGHYFVISDNRDNALDSRYHAIGPIPAANFTAKWPLIYFATDRTGIRLDRIGARPR